MKLPGLPKFCKQNKWLCVILFIVLLFVLYSVFFKQSSSTELFNGTKRDHKIKHKELVERAGTLLERKDEIQRHIKDKHKK